MTSNESELLGLLRSLVAKVDAIEATVADVARRVGSVEERLKGRDAESNGSGAPLAVLRGNALSVRAAEDPDVLLCLDFGTARSKAFATRGTDENLVDIAVGRRAGSQTMHSVLSCMFIGDDERIYFGEDAANRSELAVLQGSRRRIDSFKAIITNANPGADLRATILGVDLNPSDIRLSEGDILSLYLAYLTDLAASELEAQGISRYVTRRFTTPVFPDDHRRWAAPTLTRHYSEAVLLADHFSGQWREGITVSDAANAIRSAAANFPAVLHLVAEPEVEPVAAFGSRFRSFEPERRSRKLLTIVDVGAGTTDFATFALIVDPELGLKMYLVPNSVHALRKAGNEVDRILQELILRKVLADRPGLDASLLARIRATLSLQQRVLKERLFRDQVVSFELADDTRGEVTIEEFLADPDLQRFSSELREHFTRSLAKIESSWFREAGGNTLEVVFTGGGANLPMIQGLGRGQVAGLADYVDCVASPSLPRWVSRDYPELGDEFPQLAVAIGGASRNLPQYPEQQFASFGGLTEQGAWVIPPARKG